MAWDYKQQPMTLERARQYLADKHETFMIHQQKNRDQWWNDFQQRNIILYRKEEFKFLQITPTNGQPKIAVDLGCGLSARIIELLRNGWTVYAVDSSPQVIETLKDHILKIGKIDWLREKQLILIHQRMEDFVFPEHCDLVIAMDAFAYCDPLQLESLLYKIKMALTEKEGILKCNFFPFDGEKLEKVMNVVFNGWTITEEVLKEILLSIEFSALEIKRGKNPTCEASQFHVTAQMYKEKMNN